MSISIVRLGNPRKPREGLRLGTVRRPPRGVPKSDFARLAIAAQSKNEPVWVSKRLLAAQPAPAWGWNEGDDPRISWKDLRPFFGSLDYSSDVGGPDGFLQIANSAHNQQLLTEAAN